MGDMIREQLHIERRQEDLLKRRSAELGVTEAEIVRVALDSFMAYSGTSSRDSGAWEEEKAFIGELISTGRLLEARHGIEMIYMKGEVFLDTNVLVYAYDLSDPAKQRRAIDVLDDLSVRDAGVISTQVMSELFVVLTRKLGNALTVEQALETVTRHMRAWRVVDVTDFIVLEAARGVRVTKCRSGMRKFGQLPS